MARRGSSSCCARCSISSNSASSPAVEPAVEPAVTGGPRRRRLLHGLLGVAISLVFLVWALRGVELADVVRHLSGAHLGWYLLSAATVTCTFPLRALRWRLLLAPSAGAVRLAPVWEATAIGFMANNVLPARAGELVRSFAATRLVGIPFATALASVAVERIFDGVVIGLLLALAVGAHEFPGAASVGTTNLSALALTMTLAFIGVLACCLVLVRSRARVLPVLERLLRRLLPARSAAVGTRLLHSLTDGLAVLHSTRDVLRVLVWSFAVWLVNAASYGLAYRAFGLQDLPPTSAFLLQGVVALGVAIPQAPGFFGTFELLSKAALGLYGVPGEEAVSFAIGVHLGWFVPITAIGLAVLARTGLSLRELRGADTPR